MILTFVIDATQSIINCTDINSCSNQIISCDQGQDCNIICNGSTETTCKGATFICPFGPFHCHLQCINDCQYININASQIDGGDLTIDLYTNIQNGIIRCPLMGDCNIACHGVAECLSSAIIDSSHLISGLDILCDLC